MSPLTPALLVLLAGAAQAEQDPYLHAPRLERVMIETSLGAGATSDTPYTRRLEDFGFDRGLVLFDAVFMMQGAVVYSPLRNLGVVFSAGNLDSDSWHRDLLEVGDQTLDEDFRWTTWRSAVSGRYSLPLADGWLVPYVQAGGGPAMTLATYTDDHCEKQDRHMGWHLAGAGGLQLMPSIAGYRHLGVFVQVETSWAPVLENLAGDVHDSGRHATLFGIRAGF